MMPRTAYLSGVVKIRITGARPEQFINLCMTDSIPLWDICRTPENNDVYATILVKDFFKLRPSAKTSRSRVEAVAHHGLPFTIKKIKRRKLFIVGALLFPVALYLLSSYIWFVDITGLKTLPEAQIRQIVYLSGLKPGTEINSVNIQHVETELLAQRPEIAWININITGTRAVIEVTEKTVPKLTDKAPADIVAIKDGVISEIVAVAGQPLVKVGDTVKKGDILIKGVLPPIKTPDSPAADAQPSDQPLRPVKAQGMIKARVWYESYGEAALAETRYQRTGNKQWSLVIKINQTEIPLKHIECSYSSFEDEIIHKKLELWRNSDPAVEIILSTYYELSVSSHPVSREEACHRAGLKALEAIRPSMPETATVVSRDSEEIKTADKELVRVKVNLETSEDIGQSVTITQ